MYSRSCDIYSKGFCFMSYGNVMFHVSKNSMDLTKASAISSTTIALSSFGFRLFYTGGAI